MSEEYRSAIQSGLASFNLSDEQLEKMSQFIDLLTRWNKAFNLTAVRDPKAMIPRHLADSLAILPWLKTGPVLDVGCGPGLPGIPLAIVRPELEFVLLDGNGKKIRFVRQAVQELGLANVLAVQERVENYRPAKPFRTLTARAFAELGETLALSDHLVAPDGEWLLMKGKRPEAELAVLRDDFRTQVDDLTVPGVDGERCLVQVRRQ